MSAFDKLSELTILHSENKETLNKIAIECDSLSKTFIEKNPHIKDLFSGVIFNFDKDKHCTALKYPSSEENEVFHNATCQFQGQSPEDIASIKRTLGFYCDDGINEIDRKPCVIILGQTNAGKSSLINNMLRRRVAPQSQSRLTSRITSFTYSNTRFVAQIRKSTHSLTKLDIGKQLKAEDVSPKGLDRTNSIHADVEIRVGEANSILHGFDIFDSPGLNENVGFNSVRVRIGQSFMPLLIYVFDGRMGLLESDYTNLLNLKYEFPDLPIMYFVTKLDRSDDDKKMNEDDDDITVARRRLKKIFDRLKFMGFINKNEDMESSRIFHGANLWAVSDIHKGDAEENEVTDFHRQRYIMFEQSLTLLIKDSIEATLKEDMKKLLTTLEKVIEKSRISACDIADEIHKEKSEKLAMIDDYQKTENQLYENEVQLMDRELMAKIGEFINEMKEAGIKESIITRALKDLENYEERNVSDEILRKWKNYIKDAIDKSLIQYVKKLTVTYLGEKEIDLGKKLTNIAADLMKGRYGWPSFNTMLKNRLFYEYELSEELNESSCKTPISSGKRADRLKQFKKILTACFQTHENHSVCSEAASVKVWLQKLYTDLLDNLKNESYLKKASQTIYEEFKLRHENFTSELNEFTNYLNANKVGLDERRQLQKVSNKFAVQYVRILNISTFHIFPPIPDKDRQQFNGGSQACVYKCKIPHSLFSSETKTIVEKHYRRNEFKLDALPGDLAMEIFYCSRLTGPCPFFCNKFVTMHGLRLKPARIASKFTLSIFYEYLDLGDGTEFLETNSGKIDKRQRLLLALDVAEGLLFLHSLKITHRDIKLENILIRRKDEETFEAVIADFGFSTSLGFLQLNNTPEIGSPFYMAPEIFDSPTIEKTFDEKIDVYSFGILLWNLLSYCYDDDDENTEKYPLFVVQNHLENNPNGFKDAVKNGKRPEHRKVIDEVSYDLMENCWNAESSLRPSFGGECGIIKRLETILNA